MTLLVIQFSDMTVIRSEQVSLWMSRVHYLRQYRCDLKYRGRMSIKKGSISCHVWYIPLLLTMWCTTLFIMELVALKLEETMDWSEYSIII